MVTFILPGGSVHNKEWAEASAKKLSPDLHPRPIFWQRWETGVKEDDWIQKEADRIIALMADQETSIVAKSIGTAVAMTVLAQKPAPVKKLILCGLPLNDLEESDEKLYEALSYFPAQNLLVFQNEADPHGDLLAVKQLLEGINPEIKVISKPRRDHEYPYFSDFSDFLKQSQFTS